MNPYLFDRLVADRLEEERRRAERRRLPERSPRPAFRLRLPRRPVAPPAVPTAASCA